jgi:solute carrier family 5 (sodium-coupled monocarboxylate transporter), member 8/12
MDATRNFVMGNSTMGWVDMGVFGLMLGLSALIGCYFAWCSGRKNTAQEYLMGGKSMGVLPISFSLVSR